MSDNVQITDQLQSFILDRFPLARKHAFGPATPLLDTGLLDSLGILEVVGCVEQKFSILLSDEDLVPENFQTVGHLSAFLMKKQSTAQAPTA